MCFYAMIPQEEKALRTKKATISQNETANSSLYYTAAIFIRKNVYTKTLFCTFATISCSKKILPRSTQELEKSVAYSLIVKSFHKVSLLQR